MTKILYTDNMQRTEFFAQIISLEDGIYLELDQTAFYPKSGGVDCDLGKIELLVDNHIFQVIQVKKKGSKIIHQVDAPGLKEGDKIKGTINWPRRLELMRYHTAAHVLSGVFFKEGNVKVTGNDLILGQGRIDFNFPDFDRNKIEKFVARANELIQKDLRVETFYMKREELDSDPSLTKLVMGLPSSIKNVRIVDIKGFDKQPDGGCHVSHLNLIGKIEISKIKNKGKNNRRLYFVLK
ncbi:Alanyl-tRNA editing protein AlaX-M [Candidatus Lokiarchaeum ossiferum]|uniref:Alanyl-tRNA editing protein AlaX-M n=1 Tax=Candidatus Lokiarchaeum ossiferum TaxID=2951803 RepID=A0ABY6HNJ6_9ARCH|nr:Alanyl-tRNA editing protein AlaX-M [Candidatus Lokiarchaeum sp. B-35]